MEENGITMSTHIVFNDLLFEFIEEYCEKYLSSLASDEKESLLANNSKFLLTTSLPTYEPLSSADSDDSGDDLCYFTCDRNHILTPKLDKDAETGKAAYIYRHNDVFLVVGKPESPSPNKPQGSGSESFTSACPDKVILTICIHFRCFFLCICSVSDLPKTLGIQELCLN